MRSFACALVRACAYALVVASVTLSTGCVEQFVIKRPPARPFDAVIVPGCPSEEDGALSLCQISRAVAATILWERGEARYFITSGAAVHSRYVEAEALAAGMAALGVPADRIYLEPNALHTDENMYNSLRIARALGLHTVAVVSSRGHAAFACRMLLDWGQACGAFAVDLDAVKARHLAVHERIDALRTPAEVEWLPLDERERRLAARTGRPKRPPSFLVYPWLGYLRLNGERWTPYTPPIPPRVTWSMRAKQLGLAVQ